jgi:protocatechuate 3,4-dioxygenase beta subunit
MFLRIAAVVGVAVTVLVSTNAAPALADTCPTYNPPNALSLVAGTPQSAKLLTPFANPLEVTVINTNGCPITTPTAGIAVLFAAPGSGPSGTFSSSGSNAVLVGTNASGSAAAAQFTANAFAGGYQVVASSDFGSVSFSLVNTASGVAATVTKATPTRQAATIGSRYAQPLQATVLDATGNPVAGASVTFALGSSAGSGGGAGADAAGASFAGGNAQATELTNASGTAVSPLLSANSTVGKFTATASTAGVVEPVSFTLVNLAGKPPAISGISNSRRSARVDAGYAKPLQVRVRDGSGKPLQGVSVTFALGVSGGAGSASAAGATFVGGSGQATESTNAAGVATSPRLTANAIAGAFTATATTAGTTKAASFALHNLPRSPAAIAAGVASTESTVAGTRFPVRLAVTVTDKNGNAVAGIAVRFAAPGHGASGRFDGTKRMVAVRTDAKGVAVAPRFVANRTAGGYVVSASTGGHAAAFALVNQPAACAGKAPCGRPRPGGQRRSSYPPDAGGALRARDRDRCRGDRCGARALRLLTRRPARRDRPARHQPAHRHHRPDVVRRDG